MHFEVQISGKDRSLIEAAVKRMEIFADRWNLALPEAIHVLPAKPGDRWSYDVDTGRIFVSLTRHGELAEPVMHSVLRGILHLATAQTLAVAFALRYTQHVRLVDILCREVFGDFLVDYRMRTGGDQSIEDILVGLPDINLEQRFIEKFGEHPVGRSRDMI